MWVFLSNHNHCNITFNPACHDQDIEMKCSSLLCSAQGFGSKSVGPTTQLWGTSIRVMSFWWLMVQCSCLQNLKWGLNNCLSDSMDTHIANCEIPIFGYCYIILHTWYDHCFLNIFFSGEALLPLESKASWSQETKLIESGYPLS